MSPSSLEKCSDDPCGRQFTLDDRKGRQVTLEISCLDLLRLALVHSDQEAWVAFQQCLNETLLTWLHCHPGREAACNWQSEKYLVALAFERFQQIVVQGHMVFETLARVLMYLRVSLNGVILDTLRACSCLSAISEPDEVWNWLLNRLTSEREQRLAYLLYHCGLELAEIVRCCPQEWSDTHEVTRLRRVILKRLMNESNR